MNSSVLHDAQVEVILDEPDRQILRYRSSRLGNGTFSLEIRHNKSPSRGEESRLWLQYWIEGLAPSDVLELRVFQVDEGFTQEMGDWLEVKPKFPRGMKPILDDIRAAGFIPGLWIGPFMVDNRSRLYRNHPDWGLTS